MFNKTVIFKIFLLTLLYFSHFCRAGRNEDKLITFLLEESGYQSISRPVKDDSEVVDVKLETSLQSVLNVDEKMELLVSRLWFTYTWYDPRLTWDPKDYGGVDSIRINWVKIWTPDLLLYNSASAAIDSKFPVNVILTHDGLCTWMPLGIWISSCSIDITWFPFDEQRCRLKFGIWSYPGAKVNLSMTSDMMNLDNFQLNGEWRLIEAPAKRNVVYYACCPGLPYIDITYTIVIRRRTLYYGSNLIIPCALISSLAVFTFLLPTDTNAKITLGITILLALSVFQLIVAEIVPSTSMSVPLIGIYFAFLMVLCTISLVFTTLVINFHYRTPEFYKISPFVEKYINNHLAWLMFMSRPDKKPKNPFTKEELEELEEVETANHIMQQASTSIQINQKKNPKNPFSSQLMKMSEDTTRPRTYMSDPNFRLFTSLLKLKQELSGILYEIKFITKNIKDGDSSSDEINEWKFAARVIDRFSFIIFTLFLSFGTLGIFFSSENLRLMFVEDSE